MSTVQLGVGMEVGNAQRDVALRPTGEGWAVVSEAPSLAALVARRQARHPTRMVLEATGGHHQEVSGA
jgi:hypothetical protein